MSPLRDTLRVVPLVLALASCSPAQVQQAQQDQAAIQATLNAGCAAYQATQAAVNATGVGILPAAQTIETYASGACFGATATASLVTKALSDPGTIQWLESLKTQLSALKKG